jgi:Na+/H+-dicarboxylate symporter
MRIGLEALLGMAIYVFTVLLGLALLFIVYLVLVYTFTRQAPRQFIRLTREVLLLAFSTSSSAAVMPLSIKTAEEKLGVRPSVSQFVIPLGATINMNGTALYQGVATIFLAQAYGVDIGIAGMLLVVVMAVGASIGSPATPGVGIIILSMVLTSVGIPAAGIALIMGVDRILDMCRTAINVAGDLVTCKLMNQWIDSDTETIRQSEGQTGEAVPTGRNSGNSLADHNTVRLARPHP